MHAFMHETYQVCVKCRPGAATACSWKPWKLPEGCWEATPGFLRLGQAVWSTAPLQRQEMSHWSPVVYYGTRERGQRTPDWGCLSFLPRLRVATRREPHLLG